MTQMIQLRPQPVGLFPFPASNLLLPPVDGDTGDLLQALIQGDQQIDVPRAWQFFRFAAKGDVPSALAALDAEPDASPLQIYNRFVLQPGESAYHTAASQLKGELLELLNVAAFATGVVDTVDNAFETDGELRALCLSTSAAADIENGDFQAAQDKLRQAADAARSASPVLAATCLSQLADMNQSLSESSVAQVIQDCQLAVELAADCRLPLLLAELQLKLGMALQAAAGGQRGLLLQAVNAYQAALQNGVTQSACPELFAQLQNNLGLAYLSMPSTGSSAQLRTGVAVQSFRHALEIYTIENYPDMWASVSMNLANALQYAPSSHPQENLIQAVETYEDILQVRTRARDPVAYATVLRNQANALAHLGMFRPALEKASEACKLFSWYDQVQQAEAARELAQQINEQMVTNSTDQISAEDEDRDAELTAN